MGIFSRIKRSVKSSANAAVDKMIDPEKEMDIAITELDDIYKKAIAELLSYKATAKQMEREMEGQEAKMVEWEKRAMAAVKSGDDELAKTALREKQRCQQELAKIRQDRDEAASYAIQLNKSRKDAETKLRILKIKRGTMATQIAQARSAKGDAFGNDGEVWDRFARAEEQIDDEAIAAEVQSALDGEAMDLDFEAKLLSASANASTSGAAVPDDALLQLKAKMEADKQKRLAARAGAEPAAESTDNESRSGAADKDPET